MSRVIVKVLHLLPRQPHPKRREIPTHPKDQAMFSFYTVVWNAIILRMKCPTRAWERLPVYWVKNGRRFQRKKNRYIEKKKKSAFFKIFTSKAS
jgi:hypothetical protein